MPQSLTEGIKFFCQKLGLKGDARNQLDRASRSIALNLAEGSGKRTIKDKKKFYQISLGSLRECQAVLILENLKNSRIWIISDKLGGSLYRLIQNAR